MQGQGKGSVADDAGAQGAMTPEAMSTCDLMLAAARVADESKDGGPLALELRQRATRLRDDIAYLESIGLTEYGRGHLDGVRKINAPDPPSHTCPDKPDEPCPACAPSTTTRGATVAAKCPAWCGLGYSWRPPGTPGDCWRKAGRLYCSLACHDAGRPLAPVSPGKAVTP